MKGKNIRTGLQQSLVAVFLFSVMVCAGCASMAEHGLLPDIQARRPPDVHLSPEIVLLEEKGFADGSSFKSIIGVDGRAHLFAVDRKNRIHHVEVFGNAVMLHEILGAIEGDIAAMDVVEHPAGSLRVLAGDRQFIRSTSDQKWQEIRGNPCTRFIAAGDDLFCAFVANGKEFGSPVRRDWTVGWFILIPIAFWSDRMADKLVLAQETPNGWAIRAVFDPETEFSAGSDFMAGTDRDGFLHFLYHASGKGRAFIVAFGPGGGGAWGTGEVGEIRYAKVQYGRLLSDINNNLSKEDGKGNAPIPWKPIHGMPLAPIPYLRANTGSANLGLIGPPDSHFAVNRNTGDLGGLIKIYDLELNDGIHHMRHSENPWIDVTLNEGHWADRFEILATKDLPESGCSWIHDRGTLIRNDINGNHHVILIKSKIGFWSSAHAMCYFFNTGDDWSAPLVLGNDSGMDGRRTLSIDAAGKVFAAWEDSKNRVVGRWILRNE